jgi:cytochrome c553
MAMRISIGFMLCAALTLPPLALAASTARSEYNAAVRSKPDLVRGEKLFENCAMCHGATGDGAPDGSIPRIAGQHFRVIVKQLVDYRHGKRWDPRMERYADRHLLPDAQALADIAAFVSQQDRMAPRGLGNGAHAQRGVQVYAAQCSFCHGPGGEGDERELVPRVAGQHYEYLMRQMYDAVDGRRPNFSRAHVRLLGKLERDDIVGIADALSRAEWTKLAPVQ